MENKKKSIEYTRNERTTNKVVAFFLLLFVAMTIVNEFILTVDYATNLDYANKYVYFPISIVLVCIFAIAWIYNFEAYWLKHVLMGGLILVSIIVFFVFTTYALYSVFIPLIIATRYFNKKMIYTVSIITGVLFVVACILNVTLESVSETIQIFHQNVVYNIWQSYLDAIVYIAIPCLLVMVFMLIFGINLTKSGRNLLMEQIDNNKKIASVDAELEMAAKIQKSVLPKPYFQTENKNFTLSAFETPAKEVCGDFFDYFMAGENSMAILVADVSDKGVPAAMFMMSAKKVMQCAIESCDTLDDAIELANKLICNDNQYGMFLTLWMGVINVKSGVGKYVNAGHPYPIIKHADGSVEFIENEPDLFLGNFPKKNPKVNTFVMKPDDVLFIYTDGLTDSMNQKRECFGIKRVINQIEQSENDAEKLAKSVIESVKEFSKESVQFDDITTLCLKCNKIDEPDFASCKITSGTEGTKIINDKIQEMLINAKCPDEKRRNIGVVVDEICANINEHGYHENGEIEVNALVGDNYAKIQFLDNGKAFNPLEKTDPIITDEPQIGGLGIYFVKQLSDNFSYEYVDGKNKQTVLFIWNM